MVIVILPAYNEQESIGRLLEELHYSMGESGLDYKAVVVNDGSVDRTAEVVQEKAHRMPVVLVNHETNKGLGEAIRTGLLKGLELAGPRDILITMDADNTHSPGLILRMVRMIREGNDVVIASRYQRGARIIGVPLHRRILSRMASWLFRIFCHIRGVKDYTCGYRAYRVRLLREAFNLYGGDFISQTGFSCMVDILLKLDRLGAIINEAPLILRYDQKHSMSKIHILRTIGDTIGVLIRNILQKIRSFIMKNGEA